MKAELVQKFEAAHIAFAFTLAFISLLFLPVVLSADGGYLFLRVSVSEPITLDVSSLSGSDNLVIFPRELLLEARSLRYLLEPERILLVKPGSPTMVLEVSAEKGLSELVDERLSLIREQNRQRNAYENTIIQLGSDIAALKADLKKALAQLEKEAPPKAEQADSLNAASLSSLQKVAKLLWKLREKLGQNTIQQATSYELFCASELDRTELSVLLNMSRSNLPRHGGILRQVPPAELISSAIEKMEKEKERLVTEARSLGVRLARLRSLLPTLLSQALSVPSAVEPDKLLEELVKGQGSTSALRLIVPEKFSEFASTYLDYTEGTETSKLHDTKIFILSSAIRELRGRISRSLNPPLVAPKREKFVPPTSLSSEHMLIHQVSSTWDERAWKEFLDSIGESIGNGGEVRLRVSLGRGTFLFGNVREFRIDAASALLSALEAVETNNTFTSSQLLAQVKEKLKSSREAEKTEETAFWEFAYFLVSSLPKNRLSRNP